MKNRPEIDGLRAIAVLAVLFFHADLGCGGGYVGVDVFFVISGFLITGLILKDLDGGRFQIQKFWERRVRRILPALALVIFATLLAGWFLLLPQGFKELGESVAAQATMGSNFYFWMQSVADSGYFASAREVKPLLHTWSLAVEEQFYLLFPFLLIALKRFSRNSLVPAILLLGGVSFGSSVYCSYYAPSANFYFLPTRAWELLAGAFLAAISEPQFSAEAGPLLILIRAISRNYSVGGKFRPHPFALARGKGDNSPTARFQPKEVLSAGGLSMILCAVFFYGRETRFPGVAALLPCLGAVLFIWANRVTQTFTGRLLSTRPIVFIGLISYSLYLWHWPMLVFTQYWTTGAFALWRRILVLFISAMLAVLSWKFVETPFRKGVILKTRTQIFAFAGAIATVIFLAGASIDLMQGVPARLPPGVRRYADGKKDTPFRLNVTLREAVNGAFGELGRGDKHQPVKLLVWGDSHAMAVAPVLDVLCQQHSVRGVQATHTVTAPLVGFPSQYQYALREDSIPFSDAIITYVRRERVSDVLLVARWDYYLHHFGEAGAGSNALRRCLVATIRELRNSGARVWIMKDVPRQPWEDPATVLAQTALWGRDPETLGLPLAEYRKQSRAEDAIFAAVAVPGVVVLDPTPCFLNRANLCRVAGGGYSLYADRDHLTVQGAMLLSPLFEPIFDR